MKMSKPKLIGTIAIQVFQLPHSTLSKTQITEIKGQMHAISHHIAELFKENIVFSIWTGNPIIEPQIKVVMKRPAFFYCKYCQEQERGKKTVTIDFS